MGKYYFHRNLLKEMEKMSRPVRVILEAGRWHLVFF